MQGILQLILQLGLFGLAVVTLFFGIVVGLPVWLSHRREMTKLSGVNARQVSALCERIDELEERCEKLEEQVVSAHLLLADEQREMDKKLAGMFPGNPLPDAGGEAKPRSKRERIGE